MHSHPARRAAAVARHERWRLALVMGLACTASAEDGAAAPPARAEADDRAARRELMRQFGEQVVAAVRARVHAGIDYPEVALANRWEGAVWLAVLYPWGGGAEQISVQRSSGYPVLDAEALEVAQAMQLPARPGALRGVEFDVTFPISFRITVQGAAGTAQ